MKKLARDATASVGSQAASEMPGVARNRPPE